MKVGTDAVLLGALASGDHAQKMLDVGTGTGIVALMLAQRYPHAQIHAIEPEKSALKDAAENFSASPFSDRMKLHPASLEEFYPGEKFGLIVSNPPYYENAMSSGSEMRDKARHTSALSFERLLEETDRLSEEKSRFVVVLPAVQEKRFVALARMRNWHATEIIRISSRENEAAVRVIITFSHFAETFFERSFYLYNENMQRSDVYRELTEAFYL